MAKIILCSSLRLNLRTRSVCRLKRRSAANTAWRELSNKTNALPRMIQNPLLAKISPRVHIPGHLCSNSSPRTHTPAVHTARITFGKALLNGNGGSPLPLVAVTPAPQDLPRPADQPGDGGRGRNSPAASVEEVFSTEGAGEGVLHSLDTVVANTLPTPEGPPRQRSGDERQKWQLRDHRSRTKTL